MPTGTVGGGLLAGLCSVTFRSRSIAEVVDLAAASELATIEWGGDVHVPPGDEAAAHEARRRTLDAGLEIASYGSYLSCNGAASRYAGAVLDTAAALGTAVVRVWCPGGIEPGCDPEARREVTRSVDAVAAEAGGRGMAVYLEFHGGTLTASAESAATLLDDVAAPNLFCAWQPPYWDPRSVTDEQADLRAIGHRLGHLHVYQWDPDGRRHPLEVGATAWAARLDTASAIERAQPMVTRGVGPATESTEVLRRSALLEFLVDDDPGALAADASTLRQWLARRDPARSVGAS